MCILQATSNNEAATAQVKTEEAVIDVPLDGVAFTCDDQADFQTVALDEARCFSKFLLPQKCQVIYVATYSDSRSKQGFQFTPKLWATKS